MSFEEMIFECIRLKEGNKEFALFHLDPSWRAEIGNPVNCVMLGEIRGEIVSGDALTPFDAVRQLYAKLGKPE